MAPTESAVAVRLSQVLGRELGGLNAEGSFQASNALQVFDEFDQHNRARGAGNRDFPNDIEQVFSVTYEYLRALPSSTMPLSVSNLAPAPLQQSAS